MKKDPMATANASATTIAFVYLVCALSILMFPALSLRVAQAWVHGLDLNRIAGFDVTLGSLVFGLLTSALGGWLVGYVFALSYNYFLKK
jgi:hypothetical protein